MFIYIILVYIGIAKITGEKNSTAQQHNFSDNIGRRHWMIFFLLTADIIQTVRVRQQINTLLNLLIHFNVVIFDNYCFTIKC